MTPPLPQQQTASGLMVSPLRQLPYFRALAANHHDALLAICQTLPFTTGEILFNEGDTAEAFYAVLSGKIQIDKTSSEGREVILHVFGPGEIFAEVPIFNHIGHYPANAKALSPTTVLKIHGQSFLNLVHQHPQILLTMMTVFARRLHEFSGLIEDLSLRSVESRLAKYLLEVSQQTHTATLEVNKKTLAGILATIPETLSRSFRKLQDAGVIAVSTHRVAILNQDELAKIAQLDLTPGVPENATP
ncbi:MAG: Crp/Fnr family transcriptional regulator [Vampirovibrionales bacterium]